MKTIINNKIKELQEQKSNLGIGMIAHFNSMTIDYTIEILQSILDEAEE